MSSIPQQQGSLALINPLTYDLAGSIASATHFSHGGVGGFVELPTLLYRNTIPTHPDGNMHDGGLSSGRRKLGMIVFVQETNKFYQLIPRNPDGSIINITDWEAKSNYQKVVLLDPARDAVYDGENDVFYSGSGNADEVWTEVFVKENFSNLAALNLYSTSNAAAYAGQICSTVDTKKIYILDSNLSPYEFSGSAGSFYPLDSNPSGYLTADDLLGLGSPAENLVYTTGNQTVSGDKNFIGTVSVSGNNVVASNGTVLFIYKIAEADFPNITIDPKALYFIY